MSPFEVTVLSVTLNAAGIVPSAKTGGTPHTGIRTAIQSVSHYCSLEWPLYSQGLFIISEMKVLETAGAALVVLLYVILISLPGMGITYLGWRSSRKLRPV